MFAQSQLTLIPDAVHVAGSRDGRSSRIRRCRPWMRPWWHLSFGGERRPVEFPHGKSISLPRRASTRLTPPPTGARPALGQSRETVTYLAGTNSSDPLPSSGESGELPITSGVRSQRALPAFRAVGC